MSLTTQPRILLFDIDGTLLDPAGEGRVCFRKALEDVYGVSGPIESYNMAGKTDWQILTDLMRSAGLHDAQIEARRMDAFAAYARHVEIFTQHSQMRRLPGVKHLLEKHLSEEHFILGLVTGNVREIVPFKLRKVEINPDVFKFGAYGSDHIDRNALPGLALGRLHQMLGTPIPANAVLVIGDTPLDIICARHAGLKVLCVATGTFSRQALAAHKPDYLLDDLLEPERVMAILNSY